MNVSVLGGGLILYILTYNILSITSKVPGFGIASILYNLPTRMELREGLNIY